MKKKYLDNSLYRIFAPPVVALLAYLLVLLIFDRLSEIFKNFSPEEILLLMVITYCLFEGYRFWIKISERISPLRERRLLRHAVQISGNLLITIGVVFLGFMLYFNYYLKMSSFSYELITFLIVFVTVGILFQLFYLSIQFLDRQSALLLEKEEINRKNIEYELEVFRNRINPGFLFQTLEGVISLIRSQRVEEAEDHIDRLALFYRRILGNRYSEIIPLSEEMEKIRQYLHLRNYQYSGAVNLIFKKEELPYGIKVVPNTLLHAVQIIENTQLITPDSKLTIHLDIDSQYINLRYATNERLISLPDISKRKQGIAKTLCYYTNLPLTWKPDRNETYVGIPILKTEEEHLEN